MSGTRTGGLKAAETNKKRNGEDFYARIGRKGGKNGHTGGFAANRNLARAAGSIGGRKSHRGPGKPYRKLQDNHDIVIRMLNADYTRKEIAQEFGLSITTLKRYIERNITNEYI